MSGYTTEGKKIKEDDTPTSESCSPCDPTPQELDNCWLSGGNYDWTNCFCGASPVIVDVLGNGFSLTSATNGIAFDINGDGRSEQIAWTSTNSDDAWLALDRDRDGRIDDGRELFGNSTSRPPPPPDEEKNGFLALAEFDTPASGGNGDGVIDQNDGVFADLRLWQDTNQNGVSEAGELKTLPQLGLARIDLDYQVSRRTDENGNRFKYRAKVRDSQGAQLGRWAWDVYLRVDLPQN